MSPNAAVTTQFPARSEGEFLARYADTGVPSPFNKDDQLPLHAYVSLEKQFCPADPTEQTPEQRLAFLAGVVGRHNLYAPDLELLPSEFKDS